MSASTQSQLDAGSGGRDHEDPVAIVALADELEAQGRFLDAAQALDRLPRDTRDPALDVRMVHLRHLAFRALRGTDVPDTAWPPPAGSDPFDGPGAPEVPYAEVTPQLLATALHHHGCLIVRGLLSDSTVIERIRDGILRAFGGLDACLPGLPVVDTRPWYHPLELDAGYDVDPLATAFLRSAGGMYAGTSPRAFLDYIDALRQAGVTDLVGDYLGEEPVLSLNKCVLRQNSGGAEPTWHQDASYLGVDIRAIDLWVALTRCGGDTETMGLEILPRPMDDLAEMGGYDAVHPKAVSQVVVDRLAAEAGIRVERPLFDPGDAIFFNQVFIHRSDPRPLPAIRYAIESWWFAPSTYPDSQVPLVARSITGRHGPVGPVCSLSVVDGGRYR